jgi:hypothetical protein
LFIRKRKREKKKKRKKEKKKKRKKEKKKKEKRMNLSEQLISGKCDNKCSYTFDYKKEPVIATNYETYLMFTRNASLDVIKYNEDEYFADSFQIYRSSGFKYNNFESEGILVITHSNRTISSNKLLVNIPLYSGGSHTKSNSGITSLLTSIAKSGNEPVEVRDIVLNDFIPQKEYYVFTNVEKNIVFSRENGIYMDDENLKLLEALIPNPLKLYSTNGPQVFLSTRIATRGSGSTSDEIYIDCQPTGSSEDEIEVANSKKSTFDLTDMVINSKASLFFIIFIAIISIVVAVRFAIVHIYGSN